MQQTAELERIAELSRDDAHKELLDRVRGDVTHEAAAIIRESEQRVKAECQKDRSARYLACYSASGG